MLSYEDEIDELKRSGLLEPASADQLIAIERREVFSVHREIRIASWAAVALLVGGVTLYIRNHIETIGLDTLMVVIFLAAASCQGWVWWRRKRSMEESGASAVDEYVLLLGALLWSAGVGLAESIHHFFGLSWSRHLVILAVFHAVLAYAFGSRLVLSLSLASLAAWFGIERNVDTLFDSNAETGTRAIACAAVVTTWLMTHRRLSALRPFDPIFEHFIANLGLWGALLWSFDGRLELVGVAVLVILAARAIRHGLAVRRIAFVIYGIGYGYVGLSGFLIDFVKSSSVLSSLYFLVTIPMAIAAIIALQRKLRSQT